MEIVEIEAEKVLECYIFTFLLGNARQIQIAAELHLKVQDS